MTSIDDEPACLVRMRAASIQRLRTPFRKVVWSAVRGGGRTLAPGLQGVTGARRCPASARVSAHLTGWLMTMRSQAIRIRVSARGRKVPDCPVNLFWPRCAVEVIYLALQMGPLRGPRRCRALETDMSLRAGRTPTSASSARCLETGELTPGAASSCPLSEWFEGVFRLPFTVSVDR
jgi:hypothetical protein